MPTSLSRAASRYNHVPVDLFDGGPYPRSGSRGLAHRAGRCWVAVVAMGTSCRDGDGGRGGGGGGWGRGGGGPRRRLLEPTRASFRQRIRATPRTTPRYSRARRS